VHLDQLDQLEQQVNRDLLDPKDRLEFLVAPDSPVLSVLLDPKVTLDLPGPLPA
jgi:hypothetical protein